MSLQLTTSDLCPVALTFQHIPGGELDPGHPLDHSLQLLVRQASEKAAPTQGPAEVLVVILAPKVPAHPKAPPLS